MNQQVSYMYMWEMCGCNCKCMYYTNLSSFSSIDDCCGILSFSIVRVLSCTYYTCTWIPHIYMQCVGWTQCTFTVCVHSFNTVVRFGHRSVFPVSLVGHVMRQWWHDVMVFSIYYRPPSDRAVRHVLYTHDVYVTYTYVYCAIWEIQMYSSFRNYVYTRLHVCV